MDGKDGMAKLSQLIVHFDKIAGRRLRSSRMCLGFVQYLIKFLTSNIHPFSKNIVSENNPERNNTDIVFIN